MPPTISIASIASPLRRDERLLLLFSILTLVGAVVSLYFVLCYVLALALALTHRDHVRPLCAPMTLRNRVSLMNQKFES